MIILFAHQIKVILIGKHYLRVSYKTNIKYYDLFPECKINLGLNVVSKRPDGYHNIETIFYPIP